MSVASRYPHIGQLHGGVLDDVGGRIVAGELAAGAGAHPRLPLPRVRRLGVAWPARWCGCSSRWACHSRRRVGRDRPPARTWNVFDPRLIRWRLASPDRAAQLQSLSELRRGFEPVAAALAAGARDARAVRHPGRRRSATWSCTATRATSRPTCVADMLPPHAARGQRQRDVRARSATWSPRCSPGRTHHGLMPDRPNPEAIALHDAVARAVRTGRRQGGRARRCASSSRRPPRRCQTSSAS